MPPVATVIVCVYNRAQRVVPCPASLLLSFNLVKGWSALRTWLRLALGGERAIRRSRKPWRERGGRR